MNDKLERLLSSEGVANKQNIEVKRMEGYDERIASAIN